MHRSALALALLLSCPAVAAEPPSRTLTGEVPAERAVESVRSSPDKHAPTQPELMGWLEQRGKTPTEYVVGLFDDHDVVFLGEQHRVRHDVLLVQSLLRPLYDRGVRTLATEFGRREDQGLVDVLLAADEWNEELAREIVFRSFVWWGYREYVDVYRAAWSLNQDLAEGAPPFRILAMADSPDWSVVQKPEDLDSGRVKEKVWRGGGEHLWAAIILDAIEAGDQVLVHCGIHHAFTRYRQPVVIGGQFSHFDRSLRCGNHVFAAIGARAATVFLHAPWAGRDGYDSPMQHPAGGVIDDVMRRIGPRPVGFTVTGAPFGDVSIADSIYCHGYPECRLGDFCDGWIYTMPISEYQGVTPILGWFNAENLDRARAQSPNPAFRMSAIADFERAMAASAEIQRRWGHLR